MKKRSYILHKKLLPLVNRKDLSLLVNDLPAKREFTIFVKMTGFQIFMYKQFLSKISNSYKSILFKSFQSLLRYLILYLY
jgi:SNF2 family DNA or RNA helicase